MRENPDTSLRLLQALADEPCYPSRHRLRTLARELELDQDETLLHLKCCVDHGLVKVRDQRIRRLTGKGQEFVRNAEAEEGKLWERAKDACAQAGVAATTSTLATSMTRLAHAAIEGIG